MTLGIIAICLIVFTDALRDGTLKAGWWKRHIIKWINLLIPIAYILYTVDFKLYTIGILAFGGWFLWQGGLYLTGTRWESMWIKALKKVWEWLKKQI